MNGEKLIVFPPHEPPELEFILSGCTTDHEQKAIAQAFHTFAQGDPGSFSVQFAVLLQAHSEALKSATLLGNHATKIFHRNGDPTTNEWASKVIAKETTYKHSISTNRIDSHRRGHE
jgi:hypothetical protein